jgi:hypothetical protein
MSVRGVNEMLDQHRAGFEAQRVAVTTLTPQPERLATEAGRLAASPGVMLRRPAEFISDVSHRFGLDKMWMGCIGECRHCTV